MPSGHIYFEVGDMNPAMYIQNKIVQGGSYIVFFNIAYEENF